MNIDSIINKIKLFQDMVIDSGFRRDLGDFVQSIQQPQNQNLIFMKGISDKIQTSFRDFENNSLDSELTNVIRDSEPFTSRNVIATLQDLDSDESIEASAYFNGLHDLLNNLILSIDNNLSEINKVKEVFKKYVSDQTNFETENEQALVSLVFKDVESMGGLKEFSLALSRWDRTLRIFHQLVESKSPEISLVQIQNGSVDVIISISVAVALDLNVLIATGVNAYAAYLLYKTKADTKEITDSFLGNTKLIEQERERDKLMLENIKLSIEKRTMEIHKKRQKNDKKIEKTSIKGKVDSVCETVADHIVKGNEVKLLTAPKHENVQDNENNKENVLRQLRKKTALVRERYKKLSSEDKKLLLETYSIQNGEPENGKN